MADYNFIMDPGNLTYINTHIKVYNVSDIMLNNIQGALLVFSFLIAVFILIYVIKAKFTLKNSFMFYLTITILMQNLFIDLYFLIRYENKLFLLNLFIISLCFTISSSEYVINVNKELNFKEKIKDID